MEPDEEIPRGAQRSHAIAAWPASAMRVTHGANLGDRIAGGDVPAPGDIYEFTSSERALRLALGRAAQGQTRQIIAEGSEIGLSGEAILPERILTFLAADGDPLTVVTARHESSGTHYALPLSPLARRTPYTLVEVRDYSAEVRLAQTICISFAAGTLVTLPGGAPVAIERLRAGDMVLTRDNGPQPVRWTGKVTVRARGSLAPVVISAGTLGNLGDLVVSPHHRLFLYQRPGQRISGRAETLAQAKHLVDGDRIWRREGGFVDYHSLVFDRHEIIYAEGIPAESMMVNVETLALLPGNMAAEIAAACPGLSQSRHFAAEVPRGLIERSGAALRYRKD